MVDYRRNLVPGVHDFFSSNPAGSARRVFWSSTSVNWAPPSAARDRRTQFHVDASSYCLITCMPSGPCPQVTRTIPAGGAQSNAFTRTLAKSGIAPARNARGEYALRQRRYREHTICDAQDYRRRPGLHPLQPGQARMGAARCRLAVFILPPMRPSGAAARRLVGAPAAMECGE